MDFPWDPLEAPQPLLLLMSSAWEDMGHRSGSSTVTNIHHNYTKCHVNVPVTCHVSAGQTGEGSCQKVIDVRFNSDSLAVSGKRMMWHETAMQQK